MIRFPRAVVPTLVVASLALAGCASAAGNPAPDDPAPGPGSPPAGEPAEDASFLYVANQEAAAVTVIDTETNEVAAVIDLEALGYGANAKPHHVVVEPDASAWWVSLIGADRVLKFDRGNRVIGTVEFERPGLLALHPGGEWLFVGRSMAAVNPPQRIGRIHRSTLDMEEFDVYIPRPHALAVSPDGEWVYTGSLGENSVVAVHAESGEAELLRLPGSGQHPHTFVQYAISPDGGTLVATAEMTARLLVFDLTDPGSPRLTHEVQVGARPWHPVYSADGRHVWFGNLGADEVTLVDATTWTVAAVIRGEGLAEPHGSALSADGSRLYIANRNEEGEYASGGSGARPPGTVVVIDTETREIVDVIRTPPYAAGLGIAAPSR